MNSITTSQTPSQRGDRPISAPEKATNATKYCVSSVAEASGSVKKDGNKYHDDELLFLPPLLEGQELTEDERVMFAHLTICSTVAEIAIGMNRTGGEVAQLLESVCRKCGATSHADLLLTMLWEERGRRLLAEQEMRLPIVGEVE